MDNLEGRLLTTQPAQWMRYLAIGVAALAALVLLLNVWKPEFAYVPAMSKVLNSERVKTDQAYDIMGRRISAAQAERLMQTEEGRQVLSPAHGAVPTNEATHRLGRKAFYAETFGNEVFFSDVVGVIHGPITLWDYAKAVVKLWGRGTDNLQVVASRDVTVAGQQIKKGDVVNTGFDVPKGAWFPIGLKAKYDGGRIKVGLTCSSCHATVDRDTGKVLEGVTNEDFNAGYLIALAPNSSAYFTHTDAILQNYVKTGNPTVTSADGKKLPLPDPVALEDAVDATLMTWPPGTFDTATDMVDNPVKVPHTFTRDVHPYSWSGFGQAGPFQGLSALTNNVHSKSADTTTQWPVSKVYYDIDPEVYLATLLQRSVNPRYRYDPASGRRPTEFLATIDPTPGQVGLSEVVAPPNFPRASLLTTISGFAASTGSRVWEEINAMAAFQHTLKPPEPERTADAALVARGKAVFTKANCISCHAGSKGTNHRILPTAQVGTEPTRAVALAGTRKNWGDPLVWSFDTPIPIPPDAKVLEVPTNHLDPGQVALAMGWVGQGGYKVKDLVGLRFSAPYLHDGGVAVGPDPATQIGVANTIMKRVVPDPANSLRALLDRDLRQRVLAANRAAGILSGQYVRGQGHEFYVDKADQGALIEYLLYGRD